MPVQSSRITIEGLSVEVWRKPVKDLRIVVQPSTGKVRISVPAHLDDETVRRHLLSRLDWIRKHLDSVPSLEKRAEPQYRDGEIHYLEGKAYRLKVMENSSINRIIPTDEGILELWLKAGTPDWHRPLLLNQWYQIRLQVRAEPLMNKWQELIGERVSHWGIKRMKTLWGSCNVHRRRVWLNVNLAKVPDDLLELIIVHELLHLQEHSHGPRFKALMDKWLPDWRERSKAMKLIAPE